MITIGKLAEYFENELNALVPDNAGYEFKIWTDAGDYSDPYMLPNSNKVIWPINGLLSVATSALTPNLLVMGVNTLRLEFLVPAPPPRTDAAQKEEDLAEIQNGQFFFIQQVREILLKYFVRPIRDSMTDDNGKTYSAAMYSGVAIPGVLNIYPRAGKAMPMNVSITLNFGEGIINALDIKVLMDGEPVPYMVFNPSRSSQLSTDVQSNTEVQKHIQTSSVFGMQFTCPSTTEGAASVVYAYIFGKESNTAHFFEIDWGEAGEEIYLMLFTSANGSVSGAEFAGLNASLGEAYQNEEFFVFPKIFTAGVFVAADSSDDQITFTINSTFTKSYADGEVVPNAFPLYYYIAGKAYKLEAEQTATEVGDNGTTVATFAVMAQITADLKPSDYAYNNADHNYNVYFIASEQVTITGVSQGFTYAG